MFDKIRTFFLTPKEEINNEASEFLPAGLAVMETPPHPAPRIFLKILMAILFITFLWSILGKTEIVSIAQGVIISSGKSKTIQVFDRATVEKVYVKDGDVVKKGDILVDLDQGLAEADVERIQSEMMYNQIELLRTDALIQSITQNKFVDFDAPSNAQADMVARARERLVVDYNNLVSRLQENQSKISVAQTEIRTLQNSISQKNALLSVKQQRENNYQSLAEQSYLPKNRYLEIQEEVVSLKGDIRALRDKISEKNNEIKNLLAQGDVLEKQATTPAAEQAQEAKRNLSSLEEQLKKAEIMLKTTKLTAPVSGMVQQLTVNTVGGVLNPAEPVMVIAPQNDTLEAEVTFLNKDIGFIEVGQPAHIKIESFPYTKYGMIDGIVSVVSGDAQEDEKLGLIYKGRVTLKQSHLRVGKKDISLLPGMRLTAEIKTDTRRLIEYFLSPILSHKDESFRER